MARGLNYTFKINSEEATRKVLAFRKSMQDLQAEAGKIAGGAANKITFDSKPLTTFQQEQLKIKQQVVDIAKAKQDADRADRQAALDRMQLIRDEILARQQINTQISANRLAQQQANAAAREGASQGQPKRVTQFSNSQAEVDAYNKSRNGSMLYTSAINAEIVARAKANAEAAKQATITNNLSLAGSNYVSSSQQQAAAINKVTLSKQQLAQMLTEEKYRQQQSTAELKNNAREMLNAKGSLEQRRAALERLITAYGRMSVAERESAAGQRMAGIIKGVREQVKELDDQTKSSRGGIAGLFDSLKNNIVSTLGPLALITAAWASLKAAFSHNVEISDNFVDVQRTAKLSADEVDNLGEKLKSLNTRTNLEGLLDIGFIGGRLGVAKEDMVGFIKQLDELSVVLKKEFPGGPEAVATALGKLITVYKITQREGITLEDALRKTGSTFLELAHNGQVNVQYLQDFALRTAGVAQIAKISLPTMLAYGAVLSQAGISAQVAGTSVTRLISSLSTKRDKYFAIAQLSDSSLTLERFTKLINTDTKAALELFFKGLKAGNPSQTEFSDRLKTLAFSTGAVKNSIIALAENQDLLSEKTKVANKANEEGTSVAHNFELANNSLAASWEKIGNRITNAFTDSSASRKLAELLNALTDNKTEAERLSEEYINNKHRLDELDTTLKPLITRYDQLKKSGKLNAEQQAELRTVTAKIGDLLPGVTNRFNEYGVAIDINRGKVQELSKAQRELLELQNRSALQNANNQFNQAQQELPKARTQAERAQRLKQNSLDRFFDFFAGGDSDAEAKQNAKDKITRLSGQSYEAAKAVRALGGELTKAQKAVIDYYEVVNKPKAPKKTEATIYGTGEQGDETETVRTTEVIQAEIKALQDADKKLAITSVEFKNNIAKIKDLKKELKIALNGGVDPGDSKIENEYKAALKSRNDLQKKFDDAHNQATKKQESQDQQDITAVKLYYDSLRKEARDFNKDAKNISKGLRVNGSKFDDDEKAAIDAVKYKQETERLKTYLDQQKTIYDQFEEYKTKVSVEEANKRFKDQIDVTKTYQQKLDEELAKVPSDPGALTEDRRKELLARKDAVLSEMKQKDDEAFADAYNQALTHAQALIRIDNEYLQARKALGKNASKEEIDILDRLRLDKIASENKTNLNIKTGWEHLFDNFDKMSRKSILKRLNDAKKLIEAAKGKPVDQGGISDQEADVQLNTLNDIINKLDASASFKSVGAKFKAFFEIIKNGGAGTEEAQGALRALLNDFSGLAAGVSADVGKLGDALGNAGIGGQELQDAVKNIQGMLSGAGELASGLASGNPVDIITGSINLLSSAVSLFDRKDKNLEKKIKRYQKDLDDLGQAYKQIERDVNYSVGEDFYSNSAKEIENLQKQQALLAKQRDAEVEKKKTDEDKVRNYNDQLAEIPNKIDDIQRAITDKLVQTNFKDLASNLGDVFTDAFAKGENALASFEDAFKKVVANSIKAGLQLKLIEPEVNKFLNEYASFLKEHNNSALGFDFDKYKEILKQKGEEFTAGLEPFKDYFKTPDTTSTSSAAANNIKSITSDQASAIEGIERGTYDQVKQINLGQGKLIALQTSNNSIMAEHFKAMVAGVSHLEAINNNTFDTVVELKKNNKYLADIVINTKGSLDLRGKGLGG
jgi:TP901 family phage tail tape measure protein